MLKRKAAEQSSNSDNAEPVAKRARLDRQESIQICSSDPASTEHVPAADGRSADWSLKLTAIGALARAAAHKSITVEDIEVSSCLLCAC